MEKNFDLHTHVSLKTMLGGTDNTNRKDCWDEVKSTFLDTLTGGAISSQSSFNQIQKGNVSIAISALYSLEYAFAQSFLLKKILPKIQKDFSKDYLSKISSDSFNPYENLKEELALIKKSSKGKVEVVNEMEAIKEDEKTYLVLAVEGLHCFLNSYKYAMSDFDSVIKDLQKNFLNFINQNRVLYVGLTHLTKNNICTHSYAMKIINHEDFLPAGNGLTDYAKKMIDFCYQNNGYNKKRTLIDIKHMSIVSRIQFYKYRSVMGYTDIPIVASHIAVTGLSYNNIYIQGAKKSKEYKGVIELNHYPTASVFKYTIDGSSAVDLCFNQWSLNLYDEEIIHIINSNGIMGLIMDSRVLGDNSLDTTTKISEGPEYFSKESYEYLINNNHFNKNEPNDDNECITLDFQKISSEGLIHLFCNMMHIVMVYYEKYSEAADKLKAWDCICIGSDFDGLIASIRGGDNAAYFDNLRGEFYKMISSIRKEPEMQKYFGGLDSKVLVNKIFYSNGIRFLNKNL